MTLADLFRYKFHTMTRNVIGRHNRDYVLRFPVRIVQHSIRDNLIEELILRRLQRQP